MTRFFSRSETVVAYGLTMIRIRLRGTSVPARSAVSRRSRGSIVTAAMPLLPQHPEYGLVTRRESWRRLVCSRSHSSTHHEGWRDWPYETPATSRKGKVPIPSGSNYKAWEMWKGRFPKDLRPQTPAEVFSHMPPESLRCKECKTTYP